MGVDYNGVGGIGIKITEEIRRKLVIANDGDFDGCVETLLLDLELDYKEEGDGNYSGKENTFYLTVEGDTLREINDKAPLFLNNLRKLGINAELDDLMVIEGLRIW